MVKEVRTPQPASKVPEKCPVVKKKRVRRELFSETVELNLANLNESVKIVCDSKNMSRVMASFVGKKIPADVLPLLKERMDGILKDVVEKCGSEIANQKLSHELYE